MEVVLLLSAERDLQEAYNWVEEHRQGREQYFLQDVDLRLEHLKKFPLIGQLYRGRYRRLLIHTAGPQIGRTVEVCQSYWHNRRRPGTGRKENRSSSFPGK
jgi:flavoprotein